MAVSLFREKKQDKLADWLEENIEQCLTIIDCPAEVQRYIRTSNIMECVNRQLKKRTRLIPISYGGVRGRARLPYLIVQLVLHKKEG